MWARVDRRVVLAAIVVLALVVRLAGVGDRLSIDEGYSWIVGSAPDAGDFLDRLAAFENTPPLFYLLLVPVPLDDEVWLRLPSLVAGVASVPVLYAVVRPLLGNAAALVAALGLAVAPFHVQFSTYSRGFALATFALLLALWAAARLAQGGRRRWWWLYAAGATVALYSQYDSPLFLLPLLGALLVVGVPRRREVMAFGLAPFLTLLPWIGEFSHSRDFAGRTKADPSYADPSPSTVRDELVALFFSDKGLDASLAMKMVLLAAIVVTLMVAGTLLAQRSRTAFWLLAGAGLGALAAHAVTAFVGPDIFAVRYLTELIPPSVAVLAAGVVALPWRYMVPITVALLIGAGAVVFANRHDREVDPDYGPVARLVERAGARRVLTNSAVALYYLDEPRPLLDRPFGLGQGLEGACVRMCERPYAVVEDPRISRPRWGPGRYVFIERVAIRLVR
jgi:hypothetical protein